MNKKIAVYAGTFDPITNGHLWMIENGAKLFDTLYFSIGDNPAKKTMFSLAEREEMLKQATAGIENVIVTSFPLMFLMDYAMSIGAQFVLRGIRNVSDYEYERGMRHVNNDIEREITTVFLMPPRDLAEISSSMVKSLIGPAGWERVVKKYVPEPVFKKLLEVCHGKES